MAMVLVVVVVFLEFGVLVAVVCGYPLLRR
jgi:hypothetical protein